MFRQLLTGAGAVASALSLCTASPALAQRTDQAGTPITIGQSFTLDSTVMGAGRRIAVRLPTGYDAEENAERRYPVIYVIDGGPEQDFPHIAGIAQSGDINWTFEPFILVGIETVNRRHEIVPPATDVAAYEAELGASPGGSAQFRRFIAEEIKPWVEARYRTSGRDAVMGESLAGLFVVETLFEAPELFDDYIAVSPSMWWEEMKYGREARAYLDAIPAGDRRLYLTLADEGYRHEEGVGLLVQALQHGVPQGFQWQFVEQGDSETHASIYHGAALDAFRAFYGYPSRIYLPGPLLSGHPVRERTAEEQARRDAECTRENARATTPATTRSGMDAIAYECLLYDLGPVPVAGNFER
ncbi:MAG: alpha/beta hydrolase-fold protein [Parasphingopyxis sp.]